MSEIRKYVLVDLDDNEGGYEYDSLREACAAADHEHAVIERTYTYESSELIHTPDGALTWPPEPSDNTDAD